jgi:hypothetical protein
MTDKEDKKTLIERAKEALEERFGVFKKDHGRADKDLKVRDDFDPPELPEKKDERKK